LHPRKLIWGLYSRPLICCLEMFLSIVTKAWAANTGTIAMDAFVFFHISTMIVLKDRFAFMLNTRSRLLSWTEIGSVSNVAEVLFSAP